jgi:glycosyltransferase involved in cell wall biosynthesis
LSDFLKVLMKILMALESDFPPDLRVENEIISLIAARHSVIMACFSHSGSDAITEWNGCKIYKKAINTFIYKSSVGALKFPFYFNFWGSHLESIIRKEQPEAIHIHDLPLAKVGIALKKKYQLKCILDLHENWPALLRMSGHTNTFLGRILSSDRQWRRYEIDSCLKADNVIVVIEEALERLRGLGIPEETIKLVPNYPILSDFDNLPATIKNEVEYTFIYAGGLTEHRGLQYVLAAIPEIVKQNSAFRLVILGDGNYRTFLEKMVNDLKLNDHVEFYGKVPYKKVLEELGRADFTLIPHIKSEHTDNTIPHKLFQYMYTGKPVLASNCNPIERILIHSGAGIIYTWDSPHEFAEKALELMTDRQRISKMAANGKEFVLKYYHWGIGEDNLLRLYKEL